MRRDRMGSAARWGIPAAFVVIIIVLVIILASMRPGDDGLEVGSQAPPYVLKDLNDDEWNLTEVYSEHSATVVEFFYTECDACKDETWLNTLQRIQDNYVRNYPMKLISISSVDDDEKAVRDFRDEHEADWVFLIGTEKIWEIYVPSLETPTTVIVDNDGTVVFYESGIVDYETIAGILDTYV